MELTKYQLIDAIMHDLGDKDKGVQVSGYMNMKIITSVIEALHDLKDKLQAEEKGYADALKEKDDKIKALMRQLSSGKEEAEHAD